MGQDIPQLESQRLIMTPLALGDAPAVQARFACWDIVRYLASTVPWPYPADGALTYIRDLALPAMANGREFHWAIRPRTDPHELVGIISLKLQPDDNRGFWLDPVWQGRGLMTEACDVVTTYWFDVLHQDVLRVSKAVANTRSRAISERSGMQVIWRGERDCVSGRHEAELWEITAAQWREQRQRAAAV